MRSTVWESKGSSSAFSRSIGPSASPGPRALSGKSVGDYIDDVAAGEVVAIDNCGRTDATVWGDILTTVACRNQLAATVIDGVCRDVDRSLELGYPIATRSVTMRTGKDRVAAEAYNEPI